MQPESSDGFASVGTILPEEGAALLPGGSFRFCARKLRARRGPKALPPPDSPLERRQLYRKPAQRYNLEGAADVAQLVEQLIRNQQVVSSSLTVGSMRTASK
jgi:hypothetical protein